jgi:hypothetical protein
MDWKTALAVVLSLLLSTALIRMLSAVDVQDTLAETVAARQQLHASERAR